MSFIVDWEGLKVFPSRNLSSTTVRNFFTRSSFYHFYYLLVRSVFLRIRFWVWTFPVRISLKVVKPDRSTITRNHLPFLNLIQSLSDHTVWLSRFMLRTWRKCPSLMYSSTVRNPYIFLVYSKYTPCTISFSKRNFYKNPIIIKSNIM